MWLRAGLSRLKMRPTFRPTFTLNDGTHIPWLAFGTGTALYGHDAADSVSLAIANGITHLDGAQSYRNEESLGAGIKASGKPRSELYIVTKLKALENNQTVKQSLEESLKKLGVDYVDLFLIHNPIAHIRDGKSRLKEVWRGMEGVKRDGLATSIGVSNFTVEYLTEICDGASVLPAVNQVCLLSSISA
jgi:diketogulonate reductase-like aldo/keto reductase